jgi:hypothetical protein
VGVGIAYVDGPRLRRSLLAAADWVAAARDDLNRLNVFPVPDSDTGTNLALVAPITPVIAAHTGIGAWGILYQVEDGTNG